jgi:hypothetical protein
VTLQGGSIVQTVMTAEEFLPLTVEVGEDYIYRGYEIGGTVYPEATVTLPGELTCDTEIRLLVSYLAEDLPVVSVDTLGNAVQSRSEYVDMTLSLTGTEEQLISVPGSIRLRGDSTFSLPKKPYRIKFDQKQSLFGLEKAKSWVLLADYLEPSTLHNYAALTLAQSSEHFAFVPTPHKVNLYLNGEYAGIYTLCEQIQEQAGRLDLEFEYDRTMTDISDFNFLICMNYNAPEKAGAQEGVTYFYLSGCERYFELEYPTLEDFPSRAHFDRFFTALEDYMRETVTAFQHSNRGYLNQNVNIGSLIDFFIIDQIMGERDHHWKSVFMYFRGADGDPTLCFGPPWDYDFCMFTEWTAQPNEEFDLSNKFNPYEASVFFTPLLNSAYYIRSVRARYSSHFSEVLEQTAARVQAAAEAMAASLELNQERWYGDKPTITRDNVEFFLRYLDHRKKTLDREWG